MKKKVLISLLAAVCALSLTACAKAPEQATESKEDTTVSQPSEVTSTDAKIEVSAVSLPKDVSPLTLEQVRSIIKESETDKEQSSGRISYMMRKLDEIQKSQRMNVSRPITHSEEQEYTYYLFDGDEWTNETVVITRPWYFVPVDGKSVDWVREESVVLHRTYDTSGQLTSEEVLYNFFVDDLQTDYPTTEQIQEIIAGAQAAEAQNRNHFIYDELNKIQQPNAMALYFSGTQLPTDCYTCLLKATADKFEFVALVVPNSGTNMGDELEGDTTVYKIEQNLYGEILSQETLYEVKADA